MPHAKMIKYSLIALFLIVVALVAINVNGAPTGEDESVRGEPPSSRRETSPSSSGASSGRTSEILTSTKNPQSSSTPAPETTTEYLEITSLKNTSTFDCDGKVTGYYADVKLKCRVYHFCTQLDGLNGPTYQRMSYLCLEGSFFDQKDLNCVKEADLAVACDKAEAEYERSNKQFDPKEESQPSMSDSFAASLMMNPITRLIAG